MESLYLYVGPKRKHHHWYNFAFVSKPIERKKKENTWEKTPKTCFLKNKLYWIYFAEMYLIKYLFGLKLINTSERCLLHKNCGKTAPTRATTNKLKAALDEIPTAKRSFAEKSKQKHRKSPIFRLTLRLFHAGKQRNRNKATHFIYCTKTTQVFFGHVFFSVTETDVTIKIYKEYSKMDWKRMNKM